MKKFVLLSTVFTCGLQCCIFFLQAQTLFNTTSGGGGTINKFITPTNNLSIAKSFESLAATPYFTNFIQASNGKLYGMTASGGSSGAGAIFSFDPSSSTYTKLKDFDHMNGGFPYGSLMQASNGKLYGMTVYGGSNDAGVIFSFDPSTSVYIKLKDFDSANGSNPYGSLVQAGNGKLYGMTVHGGTSDKGVIFSFDPSSSTYTKLKNFTGTNGANPYGSLIRATDGKLYGMATYGGSYDDGVVFSINPSSSIYTKLKDCDDFGGANPYGSLMQATDGKLYGITLGGGYGAIFSFDPSSSSSYKMLFGFGGFSGYFPYGSLIQASNGKLYGITSDGKGNDEGHVAVIFSFDPSSSKYTRLKECSGTNGDRPYGSLMQASNGKLYGMTTQGGNTSQGVIFSFDPFSSSYEKLKDFGSNETGSYQSVSFVAFSNWSFFNNISSSLVLGNDKKLYGMTPFGGSNGWGVIFSFDPSSSTYKKLKDFNGPDGASPYGNLIQASNGKLYGMTSTGGSIGRGVIFSFDPSSLTYEKLKDFDRINGNNPYGSLVQGTNGKLYGMTTYGGSNQAGVIFCFDPSTAVYTKLKDFDGTDGRNPYSSLTQASDGKLYGMTQYGGSIDDHGVIFSFDPFSLTYKKLKDFDGVNGSGSNFSLIQASNGKLYGIAGIIFSFDPFTSIYTKLKDFDNTDGGFSSNLMQASNGKLYGTTAEGGSHGNGVIFSLDPSTSTYTKLKDYDRPYSANSFGTSAFIEVNENNNSPTVNLTTPANDTTYTAYGYAKIILNANASDADGTISKVEFYSNNTLLHTEYVAPYGYIWHNVAPGDYTITAKATDNDGNVTTSDAVHISVKPDIAPTVSMTSPRNGASYRAYSNIILSADANDVDGTVKKVDFYNGSTLIFTETVAPFKRGGYRLPLGNYSITVKATDNNGKVTTSQPVAISVVPNLAPVVTITSPANNTTYVSPATIILNADASDVDGTIKKVDFYNGSTLLFTENDAPYFRSWPDVPEGNYSITAIATDNEGKITTSAPVAISVIAASKSLVKEDRLNSSKEPLGLNLNPNPVANILNISVHGLQTNNKSTISVLSVSGTVIKTIQPGALNKNVQLDVSSLSGGVYFIKVINGDRVMYKQFVKL